MTALAKQPVQQKTACFLSSEEQLIAETLVEIHDPLSEDNSTTLHL